MELQNGYKVIYNAREAVTEEKPNMIYGSKAIPALTDPMCHYYGYKDNTDRELTPADIKEFKLIYSDNEYIYGSLTGIPAEDDEVLVIKDADDVVVFGKELDTTPRHFLTFNSVENAVLTGAGKYKEGAEIEVSIAPADGYKFKEGVTPTCDQCSLALDGDKYVGTITMGTEDITATFKFEVKPVAEDGYVFNGADKPTAIDSTWTAQAISKPETAVDYDYTGAGYISLAVKQTIGEIVAVYMPAKKDTNLIEDFTKSDLVSYNGADYFMYTYNELTMAPGEVDFCFQERN